MPPRNSATTMERPPRSPSSPSPRLGVNNANGRGSLSNRLGNSSLLGEGSSAHDDDEGSLNNSAIIRPSLGDNHRGSGSRRSSQRDKKKRKKKKSSKRSSSETRKSKSKRTLDPAGSASSTSALEDSAGWAQESGVLPSSASPAASINSNSNSVSVSRIYNDSYNSSTHNNNNNNSTNSNLYHDSSTADGDWRGEFAESVGPQTGIPYILDNGLPSVPVLARDGNAKFHDCIKEKDWEKLEKLLKKFDANFYKKKHAQVKERREAELLRLQQEEEENKAADEAAAAEAAEGKEGNNTESPKRGRRFLPSFPSRRRKPSKDHKQTSPQPDTPNKGIASKILPKSIASKIIIDPEDVLSPLLMVDDAGQTPLHLALIHKAPEPLLLDLLKAEKKAAMIKDSTGQVPLHCAMASWQFDHVLDKIIKAYPHALKTKNDKGKTPVGLGVQLAREKQAAELNEDIQNPFLWIHPTSKKERNWQFEQEKIWAKVNLLLKFLMKRNKTVLPSEHGLVLEALEGGANPNTINRLVSTADKYLISDDELAGTAIGLCVERHYTLDTLEYIMENCREKTTIITDAVTKALRTHYRQGCHQLREGVTPFGKQVIDWAKQEQANEESSPTKKTKAKKKEAPPPRQMTKKPSLMKKLSVKFLGDTGDDSVEEEDNENKGGENIEGAEKEASNDEDDAIDDEENAWEGMDKSCKQWWEVLNYLIYYCAYGRNFKESIKPKSYHLIHAALSIPVTPPSLIQLLLVVFPESKRELCPCYNALPIHIACTRWRYDIIRNESDTSLDKVLKLMVKADPRVLFRRHKGRLPIHLALSVGQSWTFLKAFVSVDKKSVGMRDPQSRFFPFQMAALPMTSKNVQLLMRSQFTPTEWRTMSTGQKKLEYKRVEEEQDRRQIGTIFELLRRHPDAIVGKPLFRQTPSSSPALRRTGKVSMHYLGFVYGKNSMGEFRLRAENVKLLRDAIVRADIPLEMENWWETMKQCIWEEYKGDLPRNDPYLLHAALYNPETPPLLVELLLELFPSSATKPVPGTATYPLHIAAGTTAYYRHPFEMPYGMDNLHLVMSADRRVVRRRSNGRLPLHICLSRGKSWKEVRPLVLAYSSSLMTEDPQTGLVPFQLMASFRITSRENALRYSAFIERQTRNVDLQRLSAKDKALAFNRIRKKQELIQVTCIFELLRHRPSAMHPTPVGYSLSEGGSVHSASGMSLGSRGSDSLIGGAAARVGEFLGDFSLSASRPSSVRGLMSPSPMSSRSLLPFHKGEGSSMSLISPDSARGSVGQSLSNTNHSKDGSIYGSLSKVSYDDESGSMIGMSMHSTASNATMSPGNGRKTVAPRKGKRPPRMPPRVPDLER